MFERVDEAAFIEGEHDVLRWWGERGIFQKLLAKNAGGPKWSFLDGPITANNPMGVHHAWGRTYKDAYQRYRAMTGHELRYQNGFDCQGLWVEVEVEKEMGLGTKTAIAEHGIDRFVRACKNRVLTFAARQTEQSVRLGYWMEWDDPLELRKLAEHIDDEQTLTLQTPKGETASGTAEELTARLGNPQWGGSYFTFSTENNETIWTFLKKCFERGKIYLGHDVMPWGGRAGSAYSQMEIADGRRLTTHRSCFVRFPLLRESQEVADKSEGMSVPESGSQDAPPSNSHTLAPNEYLLVWTTTPWTLTSNVAAAVNPDLEYVRAKAQIRGDEEPAFYYFAKENLDYKRLEREHKEGFGRPEWSWPKDLDKLKTIAQIFKEQGGYEVDGIVKGEELIGRRYAGPFDELSANRHKREFNGRPEGVSDSSHAEYKTKIHRELLASLNEFERDPEFLGEFQHLVDGAANARKSSAHDSEGVERVIVDTYNEFWASYLTYWLREFKMTLWRALEVARIWGIAALDRPAATTFSCHEIDLLFRQIGISNNVLREWRQILTQLSAFEADATPRNIWDVAEDPKYIRAIFGELLRGIANEIWLIPTLSATENHRVIDGGRDFKGNPHVVAGEGTGIVHIAPGCGDVDHKIGAELGLVSIAPLQEDGSFGEGFGPFTGREAINPETADLVFEQLKEKNLLVYVEEYPHIYPHCWRTGEELVFRLVDEWFINMDWRDEIKDVTRAITWLPESINGQDREVEWLSTMRDWMISKKRFWGLALPIWVNPDDPTDFKVVGSLAELKELATNGGEGWDEFEGHTPHRPWIDVVKIPSDKHEGQLLQRVEDVGNPWLDAGITPFSTMGYREQPDMWEQWYPADFVTECFPGQFRNWFYSLLALSTMMRYRGTPKEAFRAYLKSRDRRLTQERERIVDLVFFSREACDPDAVSEQLSRSTDEAVSRSTVYRTFEHLVDAGLLLIERESDGRQTYAPDDRGLLLRVEDKVPFKCLLGHRLVMDEQGQPMHKSDGTAIWFEEAAEQLGVDTLRWMYLAQNPAADLRFGTRHPNERVTLDTPEGPISETKEGLPTVKVTSKPADDVRRQVLIPLWNSYAFFVNYAVADEFDPSLDEIELNLRPEIDRWILSRLQELINVAHESFTSYDVATFMSAATTYIDDLSNWYIRRNRRRFWRSKDASDTDKTAAYQTLHEVLLTLTKLLAPCVPFITERMYQNLTQSRVQGPESSGSQPESVHLCNYPTVDEAKLDIALNRKTGSVQTLVRLAHRLREAAEQRVRQPLAELRFACSDVEQAAALEQSADIIADELNVKLVTRADNLDDLVSYAYKPNLKTLGPRYGKLLGILRKELPNLDGAVLAPLRSGQSVTVTLGGEEITLEPDDVLVSTEQASDWASGDDAGIQVALSTALTGALLREGMARDLVRHIQQARKDANLNITDRITIEYTATGEAATAIKEWSDYVKSETLAASLTRFEALPDDQTVKIGDEKVTFAITKLQ